MTRRWLAVGLVLLCGAATAKDGFEVRPTLVHSREYRELARDLDQESLLADVAGELNSLFVIEGPIGLRFEECKEPNAHYDPQARLVSVCLELIATFYESMAGVYENEDELDDAVAGAFLFVFFHEIGHALVDVLDLPITGREEDAVDQLSTWVLIDGDQGDQAVLDAALSFHAGDDEQSVAQSEFADEHSLNQQRFYNMLCWVYGSDNDDHADIVRNGHLPADRAERCESEYARLDRSWTKLLEPHVRD
jgi:hypothetical protein